MRALRAESGRTRQVLSTQNHLSRSAAGSAAAWARCTLVLARADGALTLATAVSHIEESGNTIVPEYAVSAHHLHTQR